MTLIKISNKSCGLSYSQIDNKSKQVMYDLNSVTTRNSQTFAMIHAVQPEDITMSPSVLYSAAVKAAMKTSSNDVYSLTDSSVTICGR